MFIELGSNPQPHTLLALVMGSFLFPLNKTVDSFSPGRCADAE